MTPTGEVTPCPYMEISVGSIRDHAFADLWRDGPTFAHLRAPQLQGRCGACEYAKLCGGCRARPLARSGDLMGEDFLCGYQPRGGPVIEPMGPGPDDIAWSVEAEQRLKHVPNFVRRFVKRRAESYARETGETTVTAVHLETLARRRFGTRRPRGPGAAVR